jgi:hypothetical protein
MKKPSRRLVVSMGALALVCAGLVALLFSARPSGSGGAGNGDSHSASEAGYRLERVARLSLDQLTSFAKRNLALGTAVRPGAAPGSSYLYRGDGVVRELSKGRLEDATVFDLGPILRLYKATLVQLAFSSDYANSHRLFLELAGANQETRVLEVVMYPGQARPQAVRQLFESPPGSQGVSMAPTLDGRLIVSEPSRAVYVFDQSGKGWVIVKTVSPDSLIAAPAPGGVFYLSAIDTTTTRLFRLPLRASRPRYLDYEPGDLLHPLASQPSGTIAVRPLFSSSNSSSCVRGIGVGIYMGRAAPSLRRRLLVYDQCGAESGMTAYMPSSSALIDPISLGTLGLPPARASRVLVTADARGDIYLIDATAGDVFLLSERS